MVFLNGISALTAGALLYLVLLGSWMMVFPYKGPFVVSACEGIITVGPDDPSYQSQFDESTRCYDEQSDQYQTSSATYHLNYLISGLVIAAVLTTLALTLAHRAPFYAGGLLVAAVLLLATDPTTLTGPISLWGLTVTSYLPDSSPPDAQRTLDLAKILVALIAFTGLSAAHLKVFERAK